MDTETKDINVNSNLLDIVKELIRNDMQSGILTMELNNGIVVNVEIAIVDIKRMR